MGRRSKRNRPPRGAGGRPLRPRVHHDLNVPLPKVPKDLAGRKRAAAQRNAIADRLRDTGYSVVAFSHTVFGRPDPGRDRADAVMPAGFVSADIHPVELLGGVADGGCGGAKKRKRSAGGGSPASNGGGGGGLTVLRRLNVVVEELSHLAHYMSAEASKQDDRSGGGNVADVLRTYDLVAISARNDGTFASACETARSADLIVLDYTAGPGGVCLPHRLRPKDARAAASRGAAFEVHYGPAVMDPSKRKALVRTAGELRAACLGVRGVRIVLSSGSRVVDGLDTGAMALRGPGDLVNVLRTVLGFDDRVAGDALSEAACSVVVRGQNRRAGRVVGPDGFSVRVTVKRSADNDLMAENSDVPLVGQMREHLKRNGSHTEKTKPEDGAIDDKMIETSQSKRDGEEKEPINVKEAAKFEDGFITMS